MSEQLFIRLGTQAESTIHWMVWSEQEQEIIASGELADKEELLSLQQRAGGRNATVFVPSSDVKLVEVEVPAKTNRQFLQAIPYMLEEDIAADVDECFFAIGTKRFDPADDCHYMQVAIVQDKKMQNWLAWLNESGIRCQQIFPDILALPSHSDALSVLQLGEQWLVRSGEFSGLTCEPQELAMWIELFAASMQAATEGETVSIHCYSPLPEGIISEHTYQIVEQDYLPAMQLLALNAVNVPLNLRQGRYQFKKDTSKHFKIWRSAAIVAGVALTINLVDKGLTVHQLEQRAEILEQKIKQTYVATFPSGKNLSVTIIQKELKRKLKQLGGTQQQVAFLPLIEASAAAFAEVPDLKPDNIRFDAKRGEIRLNASGSNFQSFEKFKAAAEKNALVIEQGSLNNQGNQVVGTISIKGVS
ncbi:general secretion pathway protein L [Catenovulum agarivorans DS-2]|uniref:Type II secretion system protein L n=1 Tax=Catenovulum agarivorans DS-2 TaxID=1328313 RepID=W7QTR3_9ALTE|nr:type II secretion system protein GspL [Catenovulum agarivorans]EWH11238.1 general secretion pathway protein L [Catenovulum agarivorans DS-2]